MKRARPWLAFVLLAVLAASVAPAPYFWRETTTVQAGPLADRLVLRALVVAADGVAQVSGPAGAPPDARVLKVFVREGDRVNAGAELAEIEANAKTHTTLTAPIAGTLLARRVDPGDSLGVAAQGGTQALFEIADTSKTALRAELEERDAGRIQPGLGVNLTTPGGRAQVGSGVVTRVAARIERRSIAADDARVRADGGVQALWIDWRGAVPRVALGERLEAVITLPDKPAAARVPRGAIVVRDGRTVVETPVLLWSREVPVEVGAADQALAEVRGIAAGTRVFLQSR